MKKLLILSLLLTTITAMSQTSEKNPKDLWTRSIDVSLGDNWKQKTITVPGKGTPNVIDFFRAFAKAYPCEYHDLFLQYLDGDKEVLFCHERPWKTIDKDSCFLENESFSMRVFFENDQPAALGVCCHKAITTELQDAYYFRYSPSTRKLTPMAKGSDYTGGILKRKTEFSQYKNENEASMQHIWGRCGIKSRLVWENGKFVVEDPIKEIFQFYPSDNVTEAVFSKMLTLNEMELREPERNVNMELLGGSYHSLPICIAIRSERSNHNYCAASAMEGPYSFRARGWDRNDGSTLVAIYSETDIEMILCFYLCNKDGYAFYQDPADPAFATIVGKGIPSLDQNEWRCEITPDNENLVFVRESDGQRKVFQWNGKQLVLKNK